MSKEMISNFINSVISTPIRMIVKVFILKPTRFFLVFSISFGLLFIFLVPPMQVPDEQIHFYQAYAVSNLDFIPKKFNVNNQVHFGAELPRSIFVAAETFKDSVAGKPNALFDAHLFGRFVNQPLKPNVTAHSEGGSLYSPVVYIPQAIGLSIGKLFNASPLILIWLGRMANLVVWILIIYFAIRVFPFSKWAITILALNPMVLFLAASLSADMMTIAIVFLFFSFILSLLDKEELLSRKSKLFIVFMAIILALTKPVSILFAMLVFIIPSKKFKSKKNYAVFSTGVVVAALIAGFLWAGVIGGASQVTAQAQRPGVVINAYQQLGNVIHDPFNFIGILINNYVVAAPGYPGDIVVTSFFATFGWFDTNIPLWTLILYILGLFLAILFQFGRGTSLTITQKIILILIIVLSLVGNIAAMYAYYTPVGASIIEGVQGRYFIPTSILALGIFTARRKILNISNKSLAILLGIMMIGVLGIVVLRIFIRYYI